MDRLIAFQSLTKAQLEEAVAIYKAYFDVPWEWPAEKLYELAHRPGGVVSALAALDGEAVAGLIIPEYLPGGRLWYIRYFAVRDDLRGQGWGSRILREALPAGEEAARAWGHDGCIGALLEVEVADAPPGEDRDEQLRRQAFYRRHGALITGARYPRPPWSPPEMPDFELMFIPMSAWDGRVDNRLRHRLMYSLMVEAYSIPEDAPWLIAALAPLAKL